MIVSPELMSASSAPSTSPLNICATRLDQVMANPARSRWERSGVAAQLAAERVRLLHQRLAGDDFDDVVEVLLVFHVGGLFAAHDDHRSHQLVVFLAEIDLAHRR